MYGNMVTSISTLVLVACFVGHVIFVMGDFSCLCSYSVEVPVHTTTEKSSAVIGYLYEFDCKPVNTPLNVDSPWVPIEFSHQVGYVMQSAEQMVQTCPGNPSPDDIITTTTTKTMPNISTPISSSAHTSSSTSKSTESDSSPTATSTTMSSNSSASISTTTTTSTIPESITSQFSSHAKTTTEVLQYRTTAVNAAYTITSLPNSTMTQTTTHGSITETKPFMLSTSTYHSLIQETTPSTEAAASKEMTSSKFETKTTASILYGTSNAPSKAAEVKSNDETTTSINTPESLTITSTTTFGALSTPYANTDNTDRITDSASITTIETTTTNTAPSFATDATNANTIVSTVTPSTASTTNTFSTTVTIPIMEISSSTEAKTTKTQIQIRCSDAVKSHAETYHGFTLFQGSTCLELVTYPMDWKSAENNCASRGGHLNDILSQRDEDMVISFLQSNHFTANVWIGLNDRTNENTFVWSSGHPLTYSNWKSGPLLDPLGIFHDCVVLIPDFKTLIIHYTGQWDDISCSANHAFICRYDHKTYQEVIVG
ncbi:uncharacterized protein LOC127847415 isoform X1 [Dreissena polymorpha]|uniref:uncharacterized protein LOC127847415 isoform X1 n=2 Tax=Dreissena polymorpha TaxID=45954 RepID=UPI002264DDFC|nr:uncharacterized protein LOC127847415 isoform X1 [Dreissena polymorpha]